MKIRKVIIVMLAVALSLGFYRFYHHQKSSKMKANQEILVKPITPNKSKTKVKRNIAKEAKATLEMPEERVNEKEAKQVKSAIVIPIDYLASVSSQDDIKVTYDNKLSITNPAMAASIKTMLLAGYHFDLDSLTVYQSNSDNVYQFTILLVTHQQDQLSLVGNYVTGTGQFEFVSLHGTPKNVMF
ncbi:TPA: hypothetical protein ACNZW0_001087 [Streptococcus pyogenes]|uniref:hypothetical protein n=1 Tax=Streptococcus dysgalactiae TaxID=1334 RepID=UPI0008071193|nr:hypothetical protein [Streptococcus dysgalactiae]OBZ01284.1 hypothetical protein BBG03_07680 [Streptococcus dysgalactiae subsp. equisimilis]